MAIESRENPFQMRADFALARKVLAGDREAFDQFFEQHLDSLFRFACARLEGDEALAKEMVQNSLVKAIDKLESYRGEATLLTWLCSICRFEISGHFRRQKRSPEVEMVEDGVEMRAVLETLALAMPGPEADLRRKEAGRLVHLTLDHLPPRYGQALEWRYLEGLSVREIAARLEVQPKAAESVLSRARESFRRGFQGLSKGLAGDGFRGLRAEVAESR